MAGVLQIRWLSTVYICLLLGCNASLLASCFTWPPVVRWSLIAMPVISENAFQATNGGSVPVHTSLWNRYNQYMFVGVPVAVAESALIVLLLVQWRRRKHAQAVLERRFAVEQVITELSTKLVDCAPDQLEMEIEAGLRQLLDAEDVDQVTWCAIPNDKTWNTLFVQRLGSGSYPVFPYRMPWFMHRLLAGQTVAVTQVEALPDEAKNERHYLSGLGVVSIIEVPCTLGNATKGVLGLVCIADDRPWPEALINRLVVLGNVIGDALLRKKSSDSQRSSEQRFRHLFEEAPVGIALEDIHGNLLLANPYLCSMLGYGRDEILAMRCDQFSDPEDQEQNLFQELQDGRMRQYQIEKRFLRKDGGLVWGRLNVSRLSLQAENVPLVLAMVEDITRRKEAEEKLKQAQAALHDLPANLIQAQEQERQRIARELHDDIGQRLSLLMVELEQVNRELPVFPVEGYGQFAVLLEGLDEVTSDVHQLSHKLHSSKLQYLGLNSALNE